MAARRTNALLVGALVLVLVVAGFLLRRTTDTGTAASSPSPSPSTSTSPSPSSSPSGSASPSASAASPAASPAPATITKVAFIGDSYAAGTGASDPAKRWTTLLAAANGWTETNAGHPRTGYLRAGTQAPCTADSCPPFSAVVPTVVASGAELVIVTGGANDLGEDQAAAGAAVTKTLTDLRAGLPNATIVVVNPWWDMRPMNPALPSYTETVKAAAAAINATYADTGQPLVGHVDLVTSDGLNANDAGHAALAAAVTGALKLAGLPVK